MESVAFVPYLKMCVKWMKLAPVASQNDQFLVGMNQLEKHMLWVIYWSLITVIALFL